MWKDKRGERHIFPFSNRKSYYERDGPNIGHIYLNGRLPGHPSERNKKKILRLHIVLPVGRTIASEITDFDMIAFTHQAVPEREEK